MKTESIIAASIAGTIVTGYVIARLLRPVIERRIAERVQSQLVNGLGRIAPFGSIVNDRPIAQLLFTEVSVPVSIGVTEGLLIR